MNEIAVILADDHEIVRAGLRQIIDAQPDMRVVAELGDGADVLPMLERTPCNVLVLDLSLPGVGGLEVVRLATRRFPNARVVVFSAYPEDQLAWSLVNAGAKAYLNKTRSPKELLAAIRAAAAGKSYVSEDRDEASPPATPELPHTQLSARESQVFLLLVDGMSVSDIGNTLGVTVSTASNHVAKVKEKLGVTSHAGVVRYAVRVGLVKD